MAFWLNHDARHSSIQSEYNFIIWHLLIIIICRSCSANNFISYIIVLKRCASSAWIVAHVPFRRSQTTYVVQHTSANRIDFSCWRWHTVLVCLAIQEDNSITVRFCIFAITVSSTYSTVFELIRIQIGKYRINNCLHNSLRNAKQQSLIVYRFWLFI